MKKANLIFLILILITSISKSQNRLSISAGMGLDYNSSSSLNNYLSSNWNFINNESDFTTAVEFSGTVSYDISNQYLIELDLGYSINSFMKDFPSGRYELKYNVIMPNLVFCYFIQAKGYRFAFGGGGGYHFVNLTEKIPGSTIEEDYSSKGLGLKLKAEGNTAISDNFYVLISADFKIDFLSNVSNENKTLVIKSNSEKFKMSFFGFGLKLGIKYFIN
ncbi:MAG: hypothetical protein N3A61_00945 [Ignavibacteria bacterium]|nr:hypothetical protein [Ignavibacteria bacterium]